MLYISRVPTNIVLLYVQPIVIYAPKHYYEEEGRASFV
jgi:hypothetical protein